MILKSIKPLFLIATAFAFFACEPKEDKSSDKSNSDVIRQYRADGTLKNELQMLNGKKHGVAKSYYPNGKQHQEIHYLKDIKHGLATTFYETGKKYISTEYVNGIIHGERTYYRPDGKVMAIVPYYKGEPTAGLKEFLLNGEEKKNYPEIRIKEINEILLKRRFALDFSVTNASRKVEFYLGKLDKNKQIPSNAELIIPAGPGHARLTIDLPPGAFIMKELNIIVKATTKLGNPYIAETTYNLAIENNY